VQRFADQITQQSLRLGYWMDWDNSYYTNSDENNYTIWAFLKKCWQNGWIYKGHDTMPWCPRCGTGISQHEIVTEGYQEITHKSVYLKFPLQPQETSHRGTQSQDQSEASLDRDQPSAKSAFADDDTLDAGGQRRSPCTQTSRTSSCSKTTTFLCRRVP
jgi:hypothetical protein